jgi:hypothetical protein
MGRLMTVVRSEMSMDAVTNGVCARKVCKKGDTLMVVVLDDAGNSDEGDMLCET